MTKKEYKFKKIGNIEYPKEFVEEAREDNGAVVIDPSGWRGFIGIDALIRSEELLDLSK